MQGFAFVKEHTVKNEWKRIGNGWIKIKLTQNKVALADEDDLNLLSQHRWCAINSHGKWGWYASTALWKRNGKTKKASMHRMVMGFPQDLEIDHINGNGLDNRRQNLRVATRSQNGANKPKYKQGAISKYKGVGRAKSKTKPWLATIKANGKHVHLGHFYTEEQAAHAYNAAALEAWGEFAYLNEVEL